MRGVGLPLAAAMLVSVVAQAAPDAGKLAEQLSANDRVQRREAAYALRQLGKRAKPALPALIKALSDPDQQVWADAVTAIAELGPDAADAIPSLLDGMNSRAARGYRERDKAQSMIRCAYALSRIGEAAKAPLVTALKADDSMLRAGAAVALGGMGPAATDAIPPLIENLGHDNGTVRQNTIDALGLIGPGAVEPLISSLGWPDSKVRAGGALALGAIGKAAQPAGKPLLTRLKEENDPVVRAALIRTLPRIGLDPGQIVPRLITEFTDGTDGARAAAFDALVLIRPAATTTVPVLASLLSDPNHAVRAAALLGRIGSEAKSALPALIQAATRKSPPDQPYLDAFIAIGGASAPKLLQQLENAKPADITHEHWVIQTLKGIGGVAVPELKNALSSQSPAIRVAAVGALNELGLEARMARPEIIGLSKDPDPNVRAAVMSAIVSAGEKPGDSLETLDAGLADRAPLVRLAAITAAEAIGGAARSLSKRIAERLDDPDEKVRATAFKTLASLGGSDPALAEKLAARLDDPALRLHAVQAVARLGTGAERFSPKLIAIYPQAEKPVRIAILGALQGKDAHALFVESLKDADGEIRAASLQGFAKSRPPLSELEPVLVTALNDPDQTVRRTGAQIAGLIGERDPVKIGGAITVLFGLADKENDRAFAMDALRAMRIRDAEQIVPALESSSADLKIWAIESLARMGSRARPYREKIESLMRDGNDYVRRAARKALERIGS